MARIEWVEQRLLRWAEVVTSGRDGSGFPAVNCLSQDWSPPSPGTTPTLKTAVGLGDVRATHAAISLLSMRARNTLVVHYCLRLPVEEQLERLECSRRALFDRIEKAHRALSEQLR